MDRRTLPARRRFVALFAPALALALLAGLAPHADAATVFGALTMTSATASGEPANGNAGSFEYSISMTPDGRFIAFSSGADNLVPGDVNHQQDVFVWDRNTESLRIASVGSTGTIGNNYSWRPAISADGRYVAFESVATNLVPGDTNNATDIFVHDMQTGTTTRVSVASDGTQADKLGCFYPSISADGRYVVFEDRATNLIPNDRNNNSDIVVHDMQTGTTTLVSSDANGTQGLGQSSRPQISANGRYVAFDTAAPNLATVGGVATVSQVVVKDLQTGTLTVVSRNAAGLPSELGAYAPAITPDGRYVAFYSSSHDLVPTTDYSSGAVAPVGIYLADLTTGSLERVSVTDDGFQGPALGEHPAVSGDGRYVGFEDAQGYPVVHDRLSGESYYVYTDADGSLIRGMGGMSYEPPVFSYDGRYTAFPGWDAEVGTGGAYEVFQRDEGPPGSAYALTLTKDTPSSVTVSGLVRFEPEVDAGGTPATPLSIVYRPDVGNIQARIAVNTSNVNWVDGVGATPGTSYYLDLYANGVHYQVRAVRLDDSGQASAAPLITLSRCASTCTVTSHLDGVMGTTGRIVLVTIPLDAIGLDNGGMLDHIRAWSNLGPTTEQTPLTLPDMTVSIPDLEVGVAPSGTSRDQVTFDRSPWAVHRVFSAVVPTASLPHGPSVLWVRSCEGTACSFASIPFSN